MTVEDSRKILPAKHYPSWVVFAQRQKLSMLYLFASAFSFLFSSFGNILTLSCWILQLNWLNVQLTKIWPYVDQVPFILSYCSSFVFGIFNACSYLTYRMLVVALTYSAFIWDDLSLVIAWSSCNFCTITGSIWGNKKFCWASSWTI